MSRYGTDYWHIGMVKQVTNHLPVSSIRAISYIGWFHLVDITRFKGNLIMEEFLRIRLKNEQLLYIASFFVFIIALVDIFTLPEFVISIAYIAPIYLVSFSNKQNLVYKFGLACGLLIIAAMFVPYNSILIDQIINRIIVIFSIFLTVKFIVQHRHYENKFLQIIEASPVANLVVNSSGKILLLNQEVERLFGYDRKELLGQSVDILVPSKFRSKHPSEREKFCISPSKRVMGIGRDLFGLRRNNSEFPIEIGLNPIMTKEGLFILAGIIDITERKKQENAIAAKNKELETLLYIASHDLKEPLRSMEYFSSLINDRYSEKLDDKAKTFLNKITASSASMTKLLDDINLMSQARKMSHHIEKLNLKDIIHEALNRLENKIQGTKARIYITENLPDIEVNRVWFIEAIYNLISNALKFTKEGQVPDVEIDIYDKDLLPDEIAVTVRDRGPGVNPEYSEKIFKLFQRAVNKEVEGTGTGLAIVKAIAEGHGGRVWVENRSSGGAEFIMSFKKTVEKAKV